MTANPAGSSAREALLGSAEGEPLDIRLAAGAAVAWVSAVLLLTTSARSVLIAGVGAGVLGAVVLVSRGRMPSARGTWSVGRSSAIQWAGVAGWSELALVLFCTALVLVPLAGRLAHAEASPLLAAARGHQAVVAALTLTADPRPLAATGPGGVARVAVPTSVDRLTIRGTAVAADGDVLVLAPATGWSALLPGQSVTAEGTLQPSLDGSVLLSVLFARGPPDLVGRPPWWQRLAGAVRGSLRVAAAVLPDEERGLLPGLVDGDTTDLDPVLADHFRTAGLTHLVAVSGTNCSIVVGLVVLLLQRLRWRPWVVAVAAAAVLLVFVAVARPSPSVLRAAVMSATGLLALAAGRPKAALPALSTAVLVLLVADPTLAADAGFALSVLATAALLTLAPPWVAALRRRRVPAGLAEGFAVAAAAHVVTAPVIAALSGKVSVVAVAANVLAEPVVAVTTVLGFLTAATAPWAAPLGMTFAWLAGWPCRWLVGVADFFGGLPGATVPWPGGLLGAVALLLALAALLVLVMLRPTRPVVLAALLAAVVVQIPVRTVASGWPVSGWVLVACDVGQGDALVLPAGGGAGIVIDAGPDPIAVDRCLSDLGVDHIPLLVLTHFHVDHVGGLAGVVRGRSVDRVLVSPLPDPASGVDLVRDVMARRRTPIAVARAGAVLDVGGVHLDVLSPTEPFHGTRSDPNNSSLVIRATVHGLRVLLSADAEVEAQRAMLAAGVDLRAEVLKVWHHGSAYFDPAYLAAVHPQVGVISVGLHNDYGHPSPTALQALAAAGVAVGRTDHDGDVAVVERAGHPTLVVRGAAASGATAAGTGLRSPPDASQATTTGDDHALSAADGRIVACRRVPSPSRICPRRCPPPCCWSATRSCSSSVRSARSRPPRGPPIRR